jgi:aspartate racemase
VIQRDKITTLWLTSGLFHLIVDTRLEDLKPVRQLLAGGDTLSVPHVQKFLSKLPDCKLINGYGPTENTTFTCCYSITELSPLNHSVPIGRPIGNTQAYILDSQQQPVPIGVMGELYIGGDGLARGYLNCPDSTQEKFILNPFSSELGARLYKTGDLGRYLPDGNIEFLGRVDHQVKIRGFRIELGEIESCLVQHPGVNQTVVIVREDIIPADKRLVAYVVPQPEQPPQNSELRRFLEQKLPKYMVPAAFVLLDKFPLSLNGKVDRRALPAPDIRAKLEVTFISPSNEWEIRLAQIWEEVLDIYPVGIQDDFFELGGHSLLGIRLINEIEKELGKKLPLAALFQAPTVEQLASILRREGHSKLWSALAPIQPHGSKPPIFLFQGISIYSDLASHLGSEQPVYGLSIEMMNATEASPQPY